LRSTGWIGRDDVISLSSASLLLMFAMVGFAIAIVVLGPLAAIGVMVLVLILLALLALIGTASFISSCVCMIRKSWRSSRFALLSGRATLNVLLLGCVCVVAFFLQVFILRFRNQCAKDWLIARVPMIEQYKESHGRYPPVLDGVVDLSAARLFLSDGELRYDSDSSGFRFDLSTSLLSGWSWSSQVRRWGYYD
jgi:hypothetical protein